MRKLLALARRPAVWLSVIAFAFWLIVLRAVVPPPPSHVIATGEAEYSGPMDWDESQWARLNNIADDGSAVTYTVVRHTKVMYFADQTHPHIRRTRHGEDVTPARWADINGKSLPAWQLVWRSELWRHPEGRAFVYDEEAWVKLKARFPDVFGDGATPVLHHRSEFQVSPDGRLVAYKSRDGRIDDSGDADGVTVEDSRTGRQIAFLKGVKDRIHMSPGGRYAVTGAPSIVPKSTETKLQLWDLTNPTTPKEISLRHERWTYVSVTFGPDGHYLFADNSPVAKRSPGGVVWWDTSTGRQLGQVENCSLPLLTGGGRVLVTRQDAPKWSQKCTLQFWDVASGESLGTTTLAVPVDGWRDPCSADCGGRRYLLFQFNPKSGHHHDWLDRQAESFYQTIIGKKPPDPVQVIVWDAVERREVLRVPGKRPALSANGRWLATLDEEGVIRVWDVNAIAPWTHALGYAVAAGVGTGVGLVLGLRFARWCWKGRRRRWWAIALAAFVLLVVVAYKLDEVAADRADMEFKTVYHHLHRHQDMTESELKALFGRPPDRVTTLPAESEKGARTRLMWIGWWDQKFEMEFGSDGKVGDRSTSGGRSFVEWIAGGCRD